MQIDSQVAEITKKKFEDFIEHYKSRFESSLQKHLADYQRENEVFFNQKHSLINELFLDKKSESLNAFEANINSKSSIEINQFHKNLNETKNRILKEMREDQNLIVRDFTTAMKQFSSENRQKMGDYFVSEKTKFLYEVNKSKDKFRRDLEVVNSEQLELSLTELHDLINKQRELARSEIDSLKIFKLKEFNGNIDEIISSNDKQFKAELDITLKYFLNSFESKVKDRADEIVTNSLVEVREKSKKTIEEFQSFSNKRLLELKEDFEELTGDVSHESLANNKAELDNLVTQFNREIGKQFEDLRNQSQQLFEKIEKESIDHSQKVSNQFQEKIDADFDGKLRNFVTLTEDKSTKLQREFNETLHEQSERVHDEFELKTNEVAGKVQDGIKRELKEAGTTLLLENENRFNEIVNSYVSKGEGELGEVLTNLSKSSKKELRLKTDDLLVEVEKESSNLFNDLIGDFKRESYARSEKIIFKLNSIFEEKKEVLSETSVDLLQEAKNEIYREFKEVQRSIADELASLKSIETKRLKNEFYKIRESQVSELHGQSASIVKEKLIEFSTRLNEISTCEQNRIKQLFSDVDSYLSKAEGKFTNETQQIAGNRLNEFRSELDVEIDEHLKLTSENVKRMFASEVSKTNELLSKKQSFFNEELNRKIQSVKKSFDEIQKMEEGKFLEKLDHNSNIIIESKAKSYNDKVKRLSNDSLKLTNEKIIELEQKSLCRQREEASKVCREATNSLSMNSRKLLIEKSQKFDDHISACSDNKEKQFVESIDKKVSHCDQVMDTLVSEFHVKLDSEFKDVYERNGLEFRRNIGGVYQKALKNADRKMNESFKSIINRTEDEMKVIVTKNRHSIQSEVNKEVEKFGHKIESINSFLIGKIKSESKEKLDEIRLLEDSLVQSFNSSLKEKSDKTIQDVELKINEYVRKARTILNQEINKIHRNEVDSIAIEVKKMHESISRNGKIESVAYAKNLLKNFVERIDRANTHQQKKYELMMNEYDKKARYLEKLLNSVNGDFANRKRKGLTSSVRPPVVPTV